MPTIVKSVQKTPGRLSHRWARDLGHVTPRKHLLSLPSIPVPEHSRLAPRFSVAIVTATLLRPIGCAGLSGVEALLLSCRCAAAWASLCLSILCCNWKCGNCDSSAILELQF